MSAFVWIFFALLVAVNAFTASALVRNKAFAHLRAVLLAFVSFAVLFVVFALLALPVPGLVWIFAMIAQLSHNFIGYYLRFYESSKAFDRYHHAFSAFSYALLFFFGLAAVFGAVQPKIIAAVFVFSLGVTLGVFVEMLEFILDQRGKNGLKMQKGLKDTNFDAVFNLAGAASAAVFAYVFYL